MKIIFFGSDDFAAVNLERLIASSHEVAACVTQPDRARGRGLKVTPTVVKTLAAGAGIPVLEPDDIDIRDDSFTAALKSYQSDLFVVIAYGKILPARLLEIPRIFAVNVHGSLLPRYRGAAPIHWAVIRGEKVTGVSVIKMSAAMDAGDIIAQKSIRIEDDEAAPSLRARMANLSADCLMETMPSLEDQSYTLTPQDQHAVTFAPKLSKDLGLLDWNKGASEIHCLVRGLQPWPCARTNYQGKKLKILDSEVVERDFSSQHSKTPGTVLEIGADGFVVAAGKSFLLIKRVHLEASKPMDAQIFALGHRIEQGHVFS